MYPLAISFLSASYVSDFVEFGFASVRVCVGFSEEKKNSNRSASRRETKTVRSEERVNGMLTICMLNEKKMCEYEVMREFGYKNVMRFFFKKKKIRNEDVKLRRLVVLTRKIDQQIAGRSGLKITKNMTHFLLNEFFFVVVLMEIQES